MGTLDWMEKLGDFEAAIAPAREDLAAWPEAVFAGLFREHYERLVGVAARVVGERAQAEEIADDAFWKLYRLPRLQAPGNNIAGWLYRTVTRLALDGIRSRKRASAGQLRWHRETADGAPMGGGSPVATPLRDLVEREEADRVRRTLGHLKPLQAQLLLLRYSGLSYQEVAGALRLNPASVGTMLARAETAFATAYAKEAL